MRDSQKSRVYNAEQKIRWLLDIAAETPERAVQMYGSTWYLEQDIRFTDIPSVQRYVDAVLALDTVCERWSPCPVTARARRGATKAHYCCGEIAVPPLEIGGRWALREIVVLHEISHHLMVRRSVVEGHGPEFCGAFVNLLGLVGKDQMSRLLEISLHEAGADVVRDTI